MPTSWQVSTGSAKYENASPSTATVEEPMKISPSLPGGLTNVPPIGMWAGTIMVPVPAWARCRPPTFTVPPTTGA